MGNPAQPDPYEHSTIESYLRRRLAAGRTPDEVQNRKSHLNRYARWLAGRGVAALEATGDDCADFFIDLADQGLSANTRIKYHQSLTGYYTWLVDEEWIEAPRRHEAGPMHGIERPTATEPDPARLRRVAENDFQRLMRGFAKRRLMHTRDAAICSLMYRSGVRRSEVVRIELARTHTGGSGPWLELLGKGNPPKWRTIPLAYETAEWIDRYLALRGDDPCPMLFASRNDRTDGVLRPDAISAMLDRRCAKFDIDPRALSAHQFRRASAANARRNGMDDLSILRTHGWSEDNGNGLRMLGRYTRPEADQLAHAAFHAADPTKPRPGRRVRPLKAVR